MYYVAQISNYSFKCKQGFYMHIMSKWRLKWRLKLLFSHCCHFTYCICHSSGDISISYHGSCVTNNTLKNKRLM